MVSLHIETAVGRRGLLQLRQGRDGAAISDKVALILASFVPELGALYHDIGRGVGFGHRQAQHNGYTANRVGKDGVIFRVCRNLAGIQWRAIIGKIEGEFAKHPIERRAIGFGE